MTLRFSNAELIKTSELPDLRRKIGVEVYGIIYHHGRKEGGVEIDQHIPTLNSVTYGKWYPLNKETPTKILMTEGILKRIDEHISELQEHRERLQKSLDELKGGK